MKGRTIAIIVVAALVLVATFLAGAVTMRVLTARVTMRNAATLTAPGGFRMMPGAPQPGQGNVTPSIGRGRMLPGIGQMMPHRSLPRFAAPRASSFTAARARPGFGLLRLGIVALAVLGVVWLVQRFRRPPTTTEPAK